MPVVKERELVLVLGGARSGKSSWALSYAEERYDSYLYLATAQVLDGEMAERVKRHQEARGTRWHTLEEPVEVAEALETRCNDFDAVLLDCLTLWLSNILLGMGDEDVLRYQGVLLESLRRRKKTIIIVSNEVGMGVVPEHPVGRRFRDMAGQYHQQIASIADKVVFMVAGLPLFLKGQPTVSGSQTRKGTPGIGHDMTAGEIWSVLKDIPDEASFTKGFNGLDQERRKGVAEYVLTRCNVFSGRASIFSARYNSESGLLE